MAHETGLCSGTQQPARALATVGGSSRSGRAGILSHVSLGLDSPRALAPLSL